MGPHEGARANPGSDARAGSEADSRTASLGPSPEAREPALSDDARWLAFASPDALIEGDHNELWDVFVLDRETGELVASSRTPSGATGAGYSTHPAISGDGRYVVFNSDATDLVPGAESPGVRIYRYDRVGSELIMVGEPRRLDAFPSISDDGRIVTYHASSGGIAYWDASTGEVRKINHHLPGAFWFGGAQFPSVSGNGRYIAYLLTGRPGLNPGLPPPLGPGLDDGCGAYGEQCQLIMLHDIQTGTSERIAISQNGPQGNRVSGSQSVSFDGRFVVFGSYQSLVPEDEDDSGFLDLYYYDREQKRYGLVTDGWDGSVTYDHSSGAEISPDGSTITFHSHTNNLVADDPEKPCDNNCNLDVFAFDIAAGTNELVSVTSEGAPTEGGGAGSGQPSVSGDGRYVAFTSDATNLSPRATDGKDHLYLRDRETGETSLVL